MMPGTTLLSLEAKLKSLEAMAGKGHINCPNCRLNGRVPRGFEPMPEGGLVFTCEFCLSEYIVILPDLPDGERELMGLCYSFRIEDYYTDPRAHALGLWLEHNPNEEDHSLRRRAKSKRKSDNPYVRLRRRLKQELNALEELEHRRCRAKYGEPFFPEQDDLVERIEDEMREKRLSHVYVKDLYKLEEKECAYAVRAELEKLICGKTTLSTAEALKGIEMEIDERIRNAEEKMNSEH